MSHDSMRASNKIATEFFYTATAARTYALGVTMSSGTGVLAAA